MKNPRCWNFLWTISSKQKYKNKTSYQNKRNKGPEICHFSSANKCPIRIAAGEELTSQRRLELIPRFEPRSSFSKLNRSKKRFWWKCKLLRIHDIIVLHPEVFLYYSLGSAHTIIYRCVNKSRLSLLFLFKKWKLNVN